MPEHITHRNITYRLLPGTQLHGFAGACRFIWNEIKEAREPQYSLACGGRIESPSFFTLGNAVKGLWDREPWLRDYFYSVLRYTLQYQAEAWKACFEGRSGFPKWKDRYQKPSFTIPDKVRVRDEKLAVPKVGWLSLRWRGGDPYPDGEPVKAVVRREGKRWDATICNMVAEPQQEHNGHAIGVNRNVGQVADSDGEIHRMPGLQRLETKLKRHLRALSRVRKVPTVASMQGAELPGTHPVETSEPRLV